ncbi:MAG TPA: tripartite tricarboxylate transporter substrate-binding protein [Beijerinckiaceae bacterium]|nr:tripartite tricarboxylate transporter substrate-binding protein [Beijerinckiaceae bacterium]
MALVAAAAAIVAATSASASDVADFYRGKTVNIIVGFGPGGGYDLYARLLARHLGKHIPGNPSVVVQNMDGAGGVRAANHVYNVAPKDGTVMAGVNQGAAMYKLLGGKGAQYEPARFQWIGSMASSNNTIYVWHSSGIRSLDDAKAREVSMAGSGVISDANIYPAVFNALAGTKFKVISGYPGTNESNLAIERGEVEGRGGGAYSSLVSTRPDWLRDRKVNVIAQIGFEKEPDLADVPLLLDLMKTDEQRQIATLVTLPTAIGYNHWVAPEVPADRVAALRAAYAAALKDPELLADAKKQSFEIRYKSGQDLEAMVRKAADTPKPILEKTAAILGW